MNKLNYIHCRNGRIKADTDTSMQTLDEIVQQLAQNQQHHLIVHFHGGLVSKQNALDSAQELIKHFTNGYPVFFIWESGPAETIVNNLEELLDEPVIGQLLIKIIQYVIPNTFGRSAPKTNVVRHLNVSLPSRF